MLDFAHATILRVTVGLVSPCARSRNSAILPAPGEAESGSAGVQPDKEYPGRRCADGASGPWGIKPPGVFFCHHRTPESCLENAPEQLAKASPSGHDSSQLGYDRFLFRRAGDRRRPCTYRGLSRGRSMKITERSEPIGAGSFNLWGLRHAGPCIAKELRSARSSAIVLAETPASPR